MRQPSYRRFPWLLLLSLALTTSACKGEMGEQSEANNSAPEETANNMNPLPDGTEEGVDADRPLPFQEGEDCEPHEAYFEEKVFDDVMEHWCVGCHSEGNIAGGTRLVLEPLLPMRVGDEPIQRSPDELAAIRARNYAAATTVARDLSQGVSLLLLKPTNRVEHIGGTMIDIDSDDYRALATFVARANGGATECAQAATYQCEPENPWPGHGRLRRLTHAEYNRTTSDLLGREVLAGENFAADPEIGGYVNNAAALQASPVLLEQWLNTAELLVESYMPELDQRLSCASQANRDCARQFIESFGKRAFRRPMTQKDTDRYLGLFDKTSMHLGFTEGIRDVMTAMLVSPYFLYRFELGTIDQETGVCVLGSYEIANELSYLIWGTMPDDALMQAAASGELDTQEKIAAQARRMLAEDKGVEAFRDFVFEWLHLNRFESVVRDMNTYPEFDNDIRNRMLAEAEAYVDHTYAGGSGSLHDLFGSRDRHMDAMLAAYYGLPAGTVPEDWQTHLVELDEDRAGIMGLGAMLTTHAAGDRSSPVLRGAIVRERMLCQELPPPPPALDINEGAIDPDLTTRERFTEHSTNAACVGCHRLVDPIGFAFEHYDGVGRFREVYEGSGKPIDATGAIFASDHSDAAVDGLGQLRDTLANNPDLPGCFTEQIVRYRFGIDDTFTNGCTIEVLEDGFIQGDMSFEELLVGMTQVPHFTRRAPPHWTPSDWYSGERPEPPVEMPDTNNNTPDVNNNTPDPNNNTTEPEPTPTPTPTPGNGPDLPGMGLLSTNDPSIEVTGGTSNDWGAGYCAELDVHNNGSAPVRWEVVIEVDGMINNNWESVKDNASGQVRFTGAPHNAEIAPGGKAHFGYCAQR